LLTATSKPQIVKAAMGGETFGILSIP
jgi:hypothetical protein